MVLFSVVSQKPASFHSLYVLAVFYFFALQPTSAEPVDLPLTVSEHFGPADCVGFMVGRWISKQQDQTIIEEWWATPTATKDYQGRHEVLQHDKLVSILNMSVIGGPHGAHVKVQKTVPTESDQYASIEPIWGRGDERSFKTVIKGINGKTFTYTQFDTDVLNMQIEEFRDGKARRETIVLKKAGTFE